MLGTIPIYHTTDDKRINAYLLKNVRTHQLKTGLRWSEEVLSDKAGEINFRMGIKRKPSFWARVKRIWR